MKTRRTDQAAACTAIRAGLAKAAIVSAVAPGSRSKQFEQKNVRNSNDPGVPIDGDSDAPPAP